MYPGWVFLQPGRCAFLLWAESEGFPYQGPSAEAQGPISTSPPTGRCPAGCAGALLFTLHAHRQATQVKNPGRAILAPLKESEQIPFHAPGSFPPQQEIFPAGRGKSVSSLMISIRKNVSRFHPMWSEQRGNSWFIMSLLQCHSTSSLWSVQLMAQLLGCCISLWASPWWLWSDQG